MKIVIPMAGLGTRLKSNNQDTEKPLIKVNDKELITHSLETLNIDGEFIFITRKYENKEQNKELSEILKRFDKKSIEIQIDEITNGAAETCLYAKEYIDNTEELIISNCDQYMNWKSSSFIDLINNENPDGAVVCFKSSDPKNSFAKVQNGLISEIAEKKAISENALVGIHYWKEGKTFVESAEMLLSNFHTTGSPECYISETYNYLINKDMKIIPYFINSNQYLPLGTQKDLDTFLGKAGEFSKNNPGTIICDIDGTILQHKHKFSLVHSSDPELLEGVKKKFDYWDSNGFRIILISARKESSREMTEKHVKSLGLPYDQLILGVNNGSRYLINDKLSFDDPDRAISINLITDSGFQSVDWEEFGL
tara:strand:+ start:50 stop:1150 length:1101 start_codon:yes stop_codon:yes gene_type:complete